MIDPSEKALEFDNNFDVDKSVTRSASARDGLRRRGWQTWRRNRALPSCAVSGNKRN